MTKPEPEYYEKLTRTFDLKEVPEPIVVVVEAPDSIIEEKSSSIVVETNKAARVPNEVISDTSVFGSNSTDLPPALGERYEILEYLGSGGMGTVWKVRDKLISAIFAVKVLHSDLLSKEESIKRIKQEARLAMELTHANIATVFGATQDADGRPCVMMRYIEGESLRSILSRDGKLDESRAKEIYIQIREALTYSHTKGVVHRDIKPSNIIISRTESGAEIVSLVDFGIAKSVYEELSKTQALTKSSDLLGSPVYMSPEQLLGEEIGPTSDLYSLGCVYYEMLAGHPPFTAENPVRLILQHLNETPDFGCIPKALKPEISLLLKKDPRDREQASESRLNGFSNHLNLNEEQGKRLTISVILASVSAILQFSVWTDLAITYDLSLATLCILGISLLAISRARAKFNLKLNNLQNLVLEFITINCAFSFLLLLSYFLFGPKLISNKSIFDQFTYGLAPMLVFFLFLTDRWRLKTCNLFTSIFFQCLIFCTTSLIACSIIVTRNNLAIQTVPYITKSGTSKQICLEKCLTLPHGNEFDNYRMAVLKMYDNRAYSLSLYRQICQQIIKNKNVDNPNLKIQTYLRLASTYSGKTPASKESWKISISEAIGILKSLVDKKLPFQPFYTQLPSMQQEIDTALDIAETCIDHGEPKLAETALLLKSQNMQFETGSQKERSIKLYQRISKKDSAPSD